MLTAKPRGERGIGRERATCKSDLIFDNQESKTVKWSFAGSDSGRCTRFAMFTPLGESV